MPPSHFESRGDVSPPPLQEFLHLEKLGKREQLGKSPKRRKAIFKKTLKKTFYNVKGGYWLSDSKT